VGARRPARTDAAIKTNNEAMAMMADPVCKLARRCTACTHPESRSYAVDLVRDPADNYSRVGSDLGEFAMIGLLHGVFRAQGDKQDVDLPDHDAALRTLFEWLRSRGARVELDPVGHRLVYGGRDYDKPRTDYAKAD